MPTDLSLTQGLPEPARAPLPKGQRLAALSVRYGALAVLAGVFVTFALTAPFFLSSFNLGNIAAQAAIPGVLALGLTLVMIGNGADIVTGGIDLSLAANMGLSAAVFAMLNQAGSPDSLAVAATLAVGLTIGLVNAAAVLLLRIIPLLATLAVMNITAGIELVVTQNTVIPVTSDLARLLSGPGPLGLPVPALVLFTLSALLALFVHYSPRGLRLYAAGAFPEAARAAGLSVPGYRLASFVLCGLCGSLGGLLSVAWLSGSSTGSGEMLLPVVVIALLGVVFSRRLQPTIGGALLSALFVAVLLNGFQLLNLSSVLVSGVQGLLIILVVSATTLLRREGAIQ